MKRYTAWVGQKAGGRTFLLVDFASVRLRDRFRELMGQLEVAGDLPEGSYAICSGLPRHDGEVLLVIPAAGNVAALTKLISREVALRLSVQVGFTPMSTADYRAYIYLAMNARTSATDPKN